MSSGLHPDLRSVLRHSTLLLGALLLSSCAPRNSKIVAYRPGFDLTGLQRIDPESNTIVFKRPGAPDLSNYDFFLIEPVQIRWNNPDFSKIDDRKVAELRTYFRDALQEELQAGGYHVVNFPGPRVLQISPGISGMKVPNAFLNAATNTLAPVSPIVGEVTVEVAFSDSRTNRIDAVVINKSQGSRVLNTRPLSSTEDIKAAFRKWARGIRKAVDEAHGQKTPTNFLP